MQFQEKFLKQLALEEKFGGKTYQQQKAVDDKKKSEKNKAAIGFTYEDSTPAPKTPPVTEETPIDENSESEDEFDLAEKEEHRRKKKPRNESSQGCPTRRAQSSGCSKVETIAEGENDTQAQ